jgi:E3 ubiquitin-protein ligase HUWE1
MKLKQMRQSTTRSSSGATRVSIRRQSVFEDSFNQLRYKTADEMRRRLSVTFQGEDGMDAGGLTREWYSVLAREIFNPNYALFKATIDNVTFQPNPQSYINNDHLQYFKFVGRIIGKAVCDGQLMDAHFTRSFYKHILGLPVNYHDLELIEPEYYKSMKQILEFPLELLGLDLTFSTESHDFGQVNIIDLIKDGRNIPVTDENKCDYVQLMAHHRMVAAIRNQVKIVFTSMIFILLSCFNTFI